MLSLSLSLSQFLISLSDSPPHLSVAEKKKKKKKMADNWHILEGWPFHMAITDGCLVPDAVTYETETLARALHLYIASGDEVLAAATAYPPFLPTPEPAASGSAWETGNPAPSRTRRLPPAGKISKRKSRSSRGAATTFIAADLANFRQMVEQLTGVQQAAELPGHGRLADCLPRLDTSGLLLGRGGAAAGQCPESQAEITPQGAGFGAELALPCFPTLESWGAM